MFSPDTLLVLLSLPAVPVGKIVKKQYEGVRFC